MQRPRVNPPIYLLFAIIAMVGLHLWIPIRQVIPGYFRWIGLVPAAVGLAFGAWAARMFRSRKTTIVPGEKSTSLVIDGPFNFSRNPMYLGMVLLLVGLAVGMGTVMPWLPMPLFVAAISFKIIPVEEGMLSEAFGPSFQQYRMRVRRWI